MVASAAELEVPCPVTMSIRARTRMRAELCVDLLELVGNFLHASLGARLVASLVVAAHANPADRVVADIDRIAAAQRNDLGQLPLTRVLLAGVRAIAPLECRAAEGARRVGLAASEFQAMRARIIRRNEHAHTAGAIDDRDRDRHVALGTFRDRRLGNLEAEPPRDILLRLHAALRIREARKHASRHDTNSQATTHRHAEVLPQWKPFWLRDCGPLGPQPIRP